MILDLLSSSDIVLLKESLINLSIELNNSENDLEKLFK